MALSPSGTGNQRPERQGVRVSLACVQCRTRHLRCDAASPTCSRCQTEGCQCTYVKSRRGNRPRGQHGAPGTITQPPATEVAGRSVDQPVTQDECVDALTILAAASSGQPSAAASPFGGFDSLGAGIGMGMDSDPLVDLYYTYFWPSQPCVLPRARLMQRIKRDNSWEMQFLLSVIRYVGSFYTDAVDTAPLEAQAKRYVADALTSRSAFAVQALIMYALAMYWTNEVDRARSVLNTAVAVAVAIGLNDKDFAVNNSGGDAVLAESWRRTWWMLYTEDLHMAGAQHEAIFPTSVAYMTASVDLPCEEANYISGEIPTPRSLEDYGCREFNLDGDAGISSFGYLVGLQIAIDQGCSHHTYESRNEESRRKLCNELDAGMEAWRSLLPKSKQKLVTESGRMDELLLRAHLLVLVVVVDTHRYLSTLKYDPIEVVCSCAPLAPPERLAPVYFQEAPLHTAKVLDAVERLTVLLTIPAQLAAHSPMCVCPIASPVIAALAACKHVLKGEELRVGRERIRVGIGALEGFAEVWPRAKKVVREVKIIARELLGLPAAVATAAMAPGQQLLMASNASPDHSSSHSGATSYGADGASFSGDFFAGFAGFAADSGTTTGTAGTAGTNGHAAQDGFDFTMAGNYFPRMTQLSLGMVDDQQQQQQMPCTGAAEAQR